MDPEDVDFNDLVVIDDLLVEELDDMFSDDSSSDFDAMLTDEPQDDVIILDESDGELTMDDDDTETYYDTGTSSSASEVSASSPSFNPGTDDETMDADIRIEAENNPDNIENVSEAEDDEVNEVESNVVEVQFATAVTQPVAQDVEIQTTILGEDAGPSSSNICSENQLQESSNKKRPAESEGDDDDGQTCLICMEVWSNSGPHRLSSLKCGHLFGHSCITRWLQVSRARNQKRCPQCNKRASVNEVRILYARKLVALDTIERDDLKRQLEAVERERNKLDLELKKSQLAQQLHEKQLIELRTKLADIQSKHSKFAAGLPSQTSSSQAPGTSELRLHLDYSVDINKEGGCRILAYNYDLRMVVVSQRSTNNLFSGFGISKMNSLNFSRTQFIFLHTKQIRDLAFHKQDSELLLSVSLDRCAKLLDITSNSVVQSFTTPYPLWSCCWDADNTNNFLVGCQNGSILQFDVRQTNGALGEIPTTDMSPITSLVGIPSTAGGPLPRGGFLACHLGSVWGYERTDALYNGTQLPLEGPFVSMSYDSNTDQLLVSSRPSTRSLRARHVVSELDRLKPTNSLTCNVLQTFLGSTTQNLMSRPCQMQLRNYGSIVASHQENTNTIAIWSMANGQKVCNYAVREPILDFCPIHVNDKQYLGTLSEKQFNVFKVDMN